MINILRQIFVIFVLMFLVQTSASAIDIEGDFSSRSLLIKKIYNEEDRATQEQRDILKSKKLSPTVQCMIEQIKKGNKENVELLLQAKVNPNSSYISDYPIYIAARENNFEIVKLLYEYGAKLDKGFYSELYEAVRNKNLEMANFLIEKNAKVNYQDAITSNSILYWAVKNNMIDTAAVLIQKGARIDSKSAKLIKKKKLVELIKIIESMN